MKNLIPVRRFWLPLCLLLVPLFGCGAPVIPVAVWLGKLVLYTAAVRATVQLVDQALGVNTQRVNNEVVPNQGDPARGVLPSLTVGKQNRDGTPSTEALTFSNVPVTRSVGGKWIVEKYYTDTVIEPRLRSGK